MDFILHFDGIFFFFFGLIQFFFFVFGKFVFQRKKKISKIQDTKTMFWSLELRIEINVHDNRDKNTPHTAEEQKKSRASI